MLSEEECFELTEEEISSIVSSEVKDIKLTEQEIFANMSSEEEDIELTEEEISAIKISIGVLVGLLADVGEENHEEAAKLEVTLKKAFDLDEEESLVTLCMSALRKFGGEADEEPLGGEDDEELAEEF